MSTLVAPAKTIGLDVAFKAFLNKYLSSTTQFEFKVEPAKGLFFVDTVARALKEGKKIFVYGDYDTDGIVSTAYMVEMLEDFAHVMGYPNPEVSHRIPGRSEHYGLKYDYFKYELANNDLVITSDNGTHKTFFSQLTKEDMDKLLIVDHHPNGDFSKYPNVLNPNTDGSVKISTGMLDEYLFQVFRTRFPKYGKERKEDHFRDLVAITLLSDRADENNPLVKKIIESGKKRIEDRERAIYRFLFPVFNGQKDTKISLEDISFQLNPLLNPRLGTNISWYVNLLNNKQGGESFDEMMRRAVYTNMIRKDVTNLFTQEAEEMLSLSIEDSISTNIAFVCMEECPIGINGLIAGNIFQKHMVDTIIVSRNTDGDNLITGSGRGEAIKAHLIELVNRYPEVSETIEFGGHNAAIGIRIKDLSKFSNVLKEYNKVPVMFKELKNEHLVFNKNPLKIEDYKELCGHYLDFRGTVPVQADIMVNVSATIVGIHPYRNNFIKIDLADDEGGKLSIVTKENSAIDYHSLENIELAVALKQVSIQDIGNPVVFADVLPSESLKPNNDILIKLPQASMTRHKGML